MRPRVPSRSMKITAFIFLIFNLPYWIFTRLPPFKQASLSTAFFLLLLPIRLLGKHTILILCSLLEVPRPKTRQDKTFTLIDALHVQHLSFSSLAVILSTSYILPFCFFLSLQPSPMSSVLCIWWWRWCIMSIATWRWRFFEPFDFFFFKACLTCILSYYISDIWWYSVSYFEIFWNLAFDFVLILFYLDSPYKVMSHILCFS